MLLHRNHPYRLRKSTRSAGGHLEVIYNCFVDVSSGDSKGKDGRVHRGRVVSQNRLDSVIHGGRSGAF